MSALVPIPSDQISRLDSLPPLFELFFLRGTVSPTSCARQRASQSTTSDQGQYRLPSIATSSTVLPYSVERLVPRLPLNIASPTVLTLQTDLYYTEPLYDLTTGFPPSAPLYRLRQVCSRHYRALKSRWWH